MASSYQADNSKLLWMIIGGISVVVVLFFAVQWFLAPKDQQPTSAAPSHPATTKTEPTKVEATATETSASSEVTPAPTQLVEESIVKAPLPANDSLAKEEIAKLDDIHQQLQDQQHALKQQHQDADTLLKLKEEQIQLLEAQLKAEKAS